MDEPISPRDLARSILNSPDDLEPWPLAPGALVSWRDDGRPGARFCARLVGGEVARFMGEPYGRADEGDPFPWHRFDTGYVDRDGPVMAGEVRTLDGMPPGQGGEVVAIAQAHAAPGGVLLAGRLAPWLDPGPYRAWFGLAAEWRPGGEHGMALVGVRIVLRDHMPGFPIGKMRRALEDRG